MAIACAEKEAAEKVPKGNPKSLVGVDLSFQEETESSVVETKIEPDKSLVHAGDTDSSDDEENRYGSSLDSYGKSVRNVLSKDISSSSERKFGQETSWKTKKNSIDIALSEKSSKTSTDLSCDPIFGISMVNPIVSSQSIKIKMIGRLPVPFSKIRSHATCGDLKSDWAIAAVIVKKMPPKISQKGSHYTFWTLSDLKLGLKTVTLYLFGRAYNELWKQPGGTVIAVLNPTVMDGKISSNEEARLSINSPDQVMVWGKSKDLGACKAIKKSGDPCGAFVNLSHCEYCVYHVQSQYKKFTKRSELQSAGGGHEGLRNKVLGKNEVFYAGKSFTAVPKKTNAKDNTRLQGLGGAVRKPIPTKKTDLSSHQRSTNIFSKLSCPDQSKIFASSKGDIARIKTLSNEKKDTKKTISEKRKDDDSVKTFPALSDPKADFNLSEKKDNSKNVISKRKSDSTKPEKGFEKLRNKKLQARFSSLINISSESAVGGVHLKKSSVEKPISVEINSPVSKMRTPSLTISEDNSKKSPNSDDSAIQNKKITESIMPAKEIPQKRISFAKMKALQYVRNKGPLSKGNSEKSEKPTDVEGPRRGVKRTLSQLDETPVNKKPALSEDFIRVMNEKSMNEHLVVQKELDFEAEYFEKMETKDRMEEKLLNTYKVTCKAVTCLKCNYTSFSASDSCKADRHPLKVTEATKRFFKCGKCDNRTVSLSIIPLTSCKKCSGTNWIRAPMIKEKIAKNSELSIRGGEQKFVNSVTVNQNLNLLVPD